MFKRIVLVIAPLLVLAGVWSYASLTAADEQASDTEASQTAATAADSTASAAGTASAASPAPKGLLVETRSVARGDISASLQLRSAIETEAAITVFPRLSGVVRRVLVEEGDHVDSGTPLVQMDDARLQLGARKARAEFEHLDRGFLRVEEMHRHGLISDQEHEDKRYELAQARLRSKRAELQLECATVRAPFAGVVSARTVQAGARVSPGSELLELVRLDDMVARVFVPGQHLPLIVPGQQASIASDFVLGQSFTGRVKRISPVVDAQSGTFLVTVGVESGFEHLRPGVFVDVEITTKTHRNASLIPMAAVVRDGDERYVFVVEDGRASKLRLEGGLENSEFVEAPSSLAPGMQVIVEGQHGLRDQTRVRTG